MAQMKKQRKYKKAEFCVLNIVTTAVEAHSYIYLW